MQPLVRIAPLALALAAVALLPACSEQKPAPVAPPPTNVSGKKPVPALSQDAMKQLESAFAEARKLVEEASKHRLAGEAKARAGEPSDAYPEYQEAVPLYREAAQTVEEWITPDFDKVTQEQIDAYLKPYVQEVARWQKERERMGKVPPKER